jgi:hypothetical protein
MPNYSPHSPSETWRESNSLSIPDTHSNAISSPMSSNGNLVVEHTTIVYPDLDFTSADHAIVVTAGRVWGGGGPPGRISWVGPTRYDRWSLPILQR